MVTAAVAAGISNIQAGYEIPQLSQWVMTCPTIPLCVACVRDTHPSPACCSRTSFRRLCLHRCGKCPSEMFWTPLPHLRYLDYIHVMTYDLHGSWEGYTGKNSPLYKYPTDTGGNAYLNVVSPGIDADADRSWCRKSRGDSGTKAIINLVIFSSGKSGCYNYSLGPSYKKFTN